MAQDDIDEGMKEGLSLVRRVRLAAGLDLLFVLLGQNGVDESNGGVAGREDRDDVGASHVTVEALVYPASRTVKQVHRIGQRRGAMCADCRCWK